MAGMSRATKWMLWSVGILALLFVVGVYLVVGFVASVVWSYFEPRQATEFEVSSPSCEVENETELLVELTIAPLSGLVMAVSVDELSMTGGQFTGVATLPAGATLDGLSDLERATMLAELEDDDPFVDVEDETRTVILRLSREPEATVRVDRMTLWFAYGEPAAEQDVPLVVEWSDTCDVLLAGR